MQKTPRIDPEFKDLIPPLTQGEYDQLEQNIIAHNCRDPISLWRDTIIDGHNRYEICTKHGLPYETVKIRLASREAAKIWILENQLGRRNLTDAMRIELAARKVELMGNKTYARKNIAREAKLSERTVHHYMQIKAKGEPDLLEKVMAGEIKIGTAHRQLEVITTTREEIEVEPMPQKMREFYCIRAVMSHIRQLKNLYTFLGEHKVYNTAKSGDMPVRLDSHHKRLQRLVDRI